MNNNHILPSDWLNWAQIGDKQNVRSVCAVCHPSLCPVHSVSSVAVLFIYHYCNNVLSSVHGHTSCKVHRYTIRTRVLTSCSACTRVRVLGCMFDLATFSICFDLHAKITHFGTFCFMNSLSSAVATAIDRHACTQSKHHANEQSQALLCIPAPAPQKKKLNAHSRRQR